MKDSYSKGENIQTIFFIQFQNPHSRRAQLVRPVVNPLSLQNNVHELHQSELLGEIEQMLFTFHHFFIAYFSMVTDKHRFYLDEICLPFTLSC